MYTMVNKKLTIQALWNGMYLRWIVDPTPQLEADHHVQEIIRRNKEIRAEVGQLRRQLIELEKEAEKLGLMEDLVRTSPGKASASSGFKDKDDKDKLEPKKMISVKAENA